MLRPILSRTLRPYPLQTFKPHSRNMHVKFFPMRWGTGDNYAYLLTDDSTKESWLIDPANPEDIPQAEIDKVNISAIVNTHHHNDHSSGNGHYKGLYKDKPLIAGRDSPLVEITPSDGETLKLGENLEITAIYTPCHTQDSICWYVKDTKTNAKVVFTGDTLFTAGCGRFFEGTPSEMVDSLAKLAKLSGETIVYPGHEYTKSNAKFAITVMPDNKPLQDLVKFCEKNEFTTGKFSIKDELEFNPFMKTDDEGLQTRLHENDPSELMGLLRQMKNSF